MSSEPSAHESPARRRRYVALSRCAVAAVLLFNAAWLIAGPVQVAPYSAALHNISDLGALSARWPWLMIVPELIAGVLTIAFAIGGLRPALGAPGRGEPLGAWLVALSLMGLDNVTDFFFRLPCMAAEPGCTLAVATATLSGKLHLTFGVGTALATGVAPFALAHRMRIVPAWRDFARGTLAFGVLLAALLAAYGVLNGQPGKGYVQRGMALVVGVGIVILAHRLKQVGLRGGAAAEVALSGR